MIVIMSLWRNDADRDLEGRVEHLLSKTTKHNPLRWLWITGDNDDDTAARLRRLVRTRMHGMPGPPYGPVTIIDADTGIVGDDVETRRRRGSATATEMFRHIPAEPGYVMLHESDLRTDDDVVDQLTSAFINATLACGDPPEDQYVNHCAVAGWPTIEIVPGKPQFYDVWAYRDLRGRQWSPKQTKQPPRMMAGLIEVSSFGSVWLAPAALVRDRVITDLAIVELCKQWRAEGVQLWVDPEISIEQPVEHWEG